MNENFRKWEEEHKNSTGEHRGRGRERQIGMVQMCRASSVIQCKEQKESIGRPGEELEERITRYGLEIGTHRHEGGILSNRISGRYGEEGNGSCTNCPSGAWNNMREKETNQCVGTRIKS